MSETQLHCQSEQQQSELAGKWAWFLPAAYLCHVVEEAFGGHGLMGWMAARGGVQLSMSAFLGVNAIGASALCLTAWAARRWRSWQLPLASGATIVFTNGIWHIAICITTKSYVSGALTGLILYLPIGGFILRRLRLTMSPWTFVIAVVLGVVIHRITIWLVLKSPLLQL